MKFKTMRPSLYVGGPCKRRSDEYGFIDTDDKKEIKHLSKHPYCVAVEEPAVKTEVSEVKNGGSDKRTTGNKKRSDRLGTDKTDETSSKI